MQVRVRLAEPYWRVVGQRDLELVIEPEARVRDVLSVLCRQYPALAGELEAAAPLVFIGDREAEDGTRLSEGDRLHLVWPVAGG